MKLSRRDFQKILKTSTVLKHSIPFHTLVKLVDDEDIANDKIRTHDLILEFNNVTKQFQTQTLYISPQNAQPIFSQPRDPNNKTKNAYNKILLFEVEVHHVTLIITKTTLHKTDTALPLEIALLMTKVPLLHITLLYDMTVIKEILFVLLIDPCIDLRIDMTLVTHIDLARIQEITISPDILPPSDNLPGQEILDTLDLNHKQVQETNLLTQFNFKLQKIVSTLKYI